MCTQLYFNICKEIWVKLDNELWYDHVPKPVKTSNEGKVTILWNQTVRTDRTIPNNKPNIIIRDYRQGTFMLIDTAITGDRNVIKKEAEKILKYKDIVIEIQRLWNMREKVIPVVTGATGITQTVPEQHTRKARNLELKKKGRVGHSTHTHESVNVKVQNTFHGRNNITRSTNCTHRTAATLYTLETWFVSCIRTDGIYVKRFFLREVK